MKVQICKGCAWIVDSLFSPHRLGPRNRSRIAIRAQRNAEALTGPEYGSGLAKRAARGGIITVVSQLLRVLIQVGGAVIMTRLLEPRDFGLVAMGTAITTFAALFADAGLATATIQQEKVSQERTSSLFFLNVTIGVGLMLAACCAAPLAAYSFHDPRVVPVVVAMSLSLPIAAAQAQHNALLARAMRYGIINVISLAAQFAGIVVGIYCAKLVAIGYWSLIAQYLTTTTIATVLTWRASGWMPSATMNVREARSAIRFGLYLTGFNFMNYFHRQFDNVLVGWRWGAVELGYYSRAYSILFLPIATLTASLSSVAVPALSRLNHDKDAWTRALLQIMSVTAFCGIGCCAILIASAGPLILLMLGEKWYQVIDIFRYLAIAAMFSCATTSMGQAFMSRGTGRQYFRWSLFASPVFVVSFIVGLPWGAKGVAISYSTTMFLLSAVYVAYTARVHQVSAAKIFGILLPLLVCGIVSAAMGLVIASELLSYSLLRQSVECVVATAGIYLVMAGTSVWSLPAYRDLRRTLISTIIK